MIGRLSSILLATLWALVIPLESRSQELGSQGGVVLLPQQTGQAVDVYLSNPETTDVTVTIDAGLSKNVSCRAPFPMTIEFQPRYTAKLFSCYITDLSKASQFSFRHSTNWGTRAARHSKAVVYDLPFAKGNTFPVSQAFDGAVTHSGENSIDFTMPEGTPVLAARKGVVVGTRQYYSGSGWTKEWLDKANVLLVKHSDGTIAEYAHLARGGIRVTPSQKVSRGQVLALSGSTGFSSGPHLHFVVFRPIDGIRRETFPVRFREPLSLVTRRPSEMGRLAPGQAVRFAQLSTFPRPTRDRPIDDPTPIIARSAQVVENYGLPPGNRFERDHPQEIVASKDPLPSTERPNVNSHSPHSRTWLVQGVVAWCLVGAMIIAGTVPRRARIWLRPRVRKTFVGYSRALDRREINRRHPQLRHVLEKKQTPLLMKIFVRTLCKVVIQHEVALTRKAGGNTSSEVCRWCGEGFATGSKRLGGNPWSRSIRSKPLTSQSSTEEARFGGQERVGKAAVRKLHMDLLGRVGGKEATVRSLIEYERGRTPRAPLAILYRNALERLDRDRRVR